MQRKSYTREFKIRAVQLMARESLENIHYLFDIVKVL